MPPPGGIIGPPGGIIGPPGGVIGPLGGIGAPGGAIEYWAKADPLATRQAARAKPIARSFTKCPSFRGANHEGGGGWDGAETPLATSPEFLRHCALGTPARYPPM